MGKSDLGEFAGGVMVDDNGASLHIYAPGYGAVGTYRMELQGVGYHKDEGKLAASGMEEALGGIGEEVGSPPELYLCSMVLTVDVFLTKPGEEVEGP